MKPLTSPSGRTTARLAASAFAAALAGMTGMTGVAGPAAAHCSPEHTRAMKAAEGGHATTRPSSTREAKHGSTREDGRGMDHGMKPTRHGRHRHVDGTRRGDGMDRGMAPRVDVQPRSPFVGRVEAGHRAHLYRQQPAVAANLTVEMGGNRVLDGRMLFDTQLGKSRIDIPGGTTMVFDGETAWVAPRDASVSKARFHLLTWPYFFAVPFKLNDPGVVVRYLGDQPFDGDESLPAAKVTFREGVGDTPDDWYVVYRDPMSGRVQGMGYVVTYGKSLSEAEENPHAIVYSDWRDIDGVPVPHEWSLHEWSYEQGVTGEPIGRVMLSGVRFVDPPPQRFMRPGGARRSGLPGES